MSNAEFERDVELLDMEAVLAVATGTLAGRKKRRVYSLCVTG